MMAAGRLSHNADLASSAPTGWLTLGENVGMGGNADALNEAFWNSPDHRANILGHYDTMGIGAGINQDGTIFVTVDFLKWKPGAGGGAQAANCVDQNPPSRQSPAAAARGYYVLGNDGGIFSYGTAPFLGSVPGRGEHITAVLMALTPSQHGYWVLGADGSVFGFGDAPVLGSLRGQVGGGGAVPVDLKPSSTGKGYWILDSHGDVHSFGDAHSHGSLLTAGVHSTATRLVPTPSGNGYWILGRDGGVFGFGDASFHGSLPGLGVHDSSISLATTPTGNGYWVLGVDGGIFSFGDATFMGSVPGLGCQQATGAQLVPSADGGGYYVLSSDGRVFTFGDSPSYGQPAGLGVTAVDLAVVTGQPKARASQAAKHPARKASRAAVSGRKRR